MCLKIEDFWVQKKLQFDLISKYKENREGDNYDKEARRKTQYTNYNFSQFNGQGEKDSICSPNNNITFNIDDINEIRLIQEYHEEEEKKKEELEKKEKEEKAKKEKKKDSDLDLSDSDSDDSSSDSSDDFSVDFSDDSARRRRRRQRQLQFETQEEEFEQDDLDLFDDTFTDILADEKVSKVTDSFYKPKKLKLCSLNFNICSGNLCDLREKNIYELRIFNDSSPKNMYYIVNKNYTYGNKSGWNIQHISRSLNKDKPYYHHTFSHDIVY